MNINDFDIYICAIGFMFLSEFIIWIFAASGSKKIEKSLIKVQFG